MLPDIQIWSGDTVASEYMPLILYLATQALFLLILSVCLCKVSALSKTTAGAHIPTISANKIKTLFAERQADLKKLVQGVEISRIEDGKFQKPIYDSLAIILICMT